MTVSVGPARGAVLRSALATVEVMAGVTAAHTWAGGALPATPWLVGLAGLVYAASLAAVRGRTDLRLLVIGLGLAQFLLHGFLVWLAPAEHVHAVPAVQDASVLDPSALGLTWPMAGAHLASAVLTALVWRLRRRAFETVLAWSDLVPVLPPWRTGSLADSATRLPRPLSWLEAAPRRGPPVLLTCA